MKFTAVFLTVAAMCATALACKCGSATEDCCKLAGGKMNGDDCKASSISNNLSGFAACCTFIHAKHSDCRCSAFCFKREARAKRALMSRKSVGGDDVSSIIDEVSSVIDDASSVIDEVSSGDVSSAVNDTISTVENA